LLFFAVALIASGLTAIVPLQGLRMLAPILASGSTVVRGWSALAAWLHFVHRALEDTYASYPFLAYGSAAFPSSGGWSTLFSASEG